jgi:hypothetical protein
MTKLKILYYTGLVVFSACVRALTWNNNFLNIDELEWIYLLHRIKTNPIPFEGFVAHTTGPLAIYLLSILNFFQESPTLSGLRQFQFFVCIVPTFYFLYRSVSSDGKWLSFLIFFLFIITNDSHYSLTASVNDFFAYNTEYLLMVVIAAIYFIQRVKNPSSIRIISVVLLCFGLFFIKSQAIVFAGYFLCIYFIQLYLYDIKRAYLLVIYSIFFASLIIISLLGSGLWDSFLVEYLYKNFLYAQLNNTNFLSQLVSVKQVFVESILFFWIIAGALVCYLLWRIIKLNEIAFFTFDSLKAYLLLFISLFVVFVSTNNFNHYKVFLFFPMSLTLGEVFATFRIKLVQQKMQLLILLIFSYAFFYRSVVFEISQNFSYSKLREYRNSIGVNPLYARGANPFWSTNNNLDKSERIRVFQYLRRKLNSDNYNRKIYIFGWFVSQGYYYELLKFGVPVSKSAQNQYLLNWFFAKDFVNYQMEENQLILELKKNKPEWILDSEGVLTSLRNLPIEKYVIGNYTVVFKSENFTVYKSRHF